MAEKFSFFRRGAAEGDGRAIRFVPEGALIPEACACCGGSASSSRLEQSPDRSRSVIVPYCDRCLRHASARITRNLAAALSSCLLALTLALALPIAWPHAGSILFAVVVVVLSAAPLGWRLLPARAPAAGHTAVERAVWWLRDGSLACTNRRWAAALAGANDGTASALSTGESRLSPWLAAGPVLAVIAGPAGWVLHHPLVRVLDLSGARIVVTVDGHDIASVEPTSSENPAAGLDLRIASGERRLVARTADGAVVADVRVRLTSGARHLWAPASTGYCFWLEETHYGRASATSAPIEPLTGPERFWTLPGKIDTWFAPNPPAAADQRSTGGVLVALRQARCSEAPPEARP